jgi:UDP-N-acetylmuramoyl-tripeptide--D-alanyl-D-alanine ligase
LQVENTFIALGDLARYHRRRFDVPLLASPARMVKTTTRALIAAALSPLGRVLSSSGNFNNEIGVPQTLFQFNATHRACRRGNGYAWRGQIEYLAKVAEPTIGVITNIGPQHIEQLGSVENIARAKAELVQNLPTDGVAILPAEGEFAKLLRDLATCRVGDIRQQRAS